MQQKGELASTVGQSRRRTRVVRVAVDDHGRARKIEAARPERGLLDAEAARAEDDELRSKCPDDLPARRVTTARRRGRGCRRRRPARSSPATSARHRTAARSTLRRTRAAAAGPAPMPRPRRALRASSRRSRRHGPDTESNRERPHRLHHVAERPWIERQHLHVDRARRRQLAARHGAHRAQILGDDQIRAQSLEQVGVDRVQRATVPGCACEPHRRLRRSTCSRSRSPSR